MRLALTAATVGTLMLSAGDSLAVPSTWLPAPATNDWNTGTNWNTGIAPEIPGDSAIFGVSATTNPTLSFGIFIDSITFNPGASIYTIVNPTLITLGTGAGIVNNSAVDQTINNSASQSLLTFLDATSAANAIINNSGNSVVFPGAVTAFFNTSTASTATITNSGNNSRTIFSDTSTAAGATISNSGLFSSTDFFNSASAGAASISNDSGGSIISFSQTSTAANSALTNNTFGFIDFRNSSTAAGATIDNIGSGFIEFFDNSSGGNASIDNSGATGVVSFFDSSTAGAATIDNSGSGPTPSAITGFFNSSSGGTAVIFNSGDGSQTIFSDTSTAAGAFIRNVGVDSSTNFFLNASSGAATISNETDGTSISFFAASTGGAGSVLINNAFGFIDFYDNSSAGGATVNNTAGSFVDFFNSSNGGTATINNTNPLGLINFFDTSSAGAATINNSGAGATPATSALVAFFNSASAGNSQIFNSGTNTQTLFSDGTNAGAATIVNSGTTTTTLFTTNASAASATIINSGAGSSTTFADSASGGAATLVNANPTAVFDISQLTTPGTTAGSIAGNGIFYLGSKDLAVGTNNTSTTFSGVIQDGGIGGGDGGSLTKVGLGTLTLTGANIFTGDTTINSGALIIDGSTVSPSTFVNGGGLLGGRGTLGGNLFNHGTVAPGHLPSGLTVEGNYSQSPEGDLRINIASNSTYGRLKVGGTADVAGSVTAVGADGFQPKRGDTFTFLTADGGVLGRFDQLNSTFGFGDTILTLVLVYDPNAVSLQVQTGSFGDFADTFGLTPNQRSVARALDRVTFNQRERRLIDFLSQRSLRDLPEDFDRIAPEELAAAFDIGFGLAHVQAANLQRRTEDVRSGSNGFSAAGLAVQGSGPSYSGRPAFRTGSAGPSGNEGKDSKAFEPAAENRWGVFLSGVGEWIDVDGDGNARGYEITTGGFTVGIDYKVTSNFAVGLSAGYAGTGADLNGGGRVFVNGAKLGLYATYYTGGFYVDGAVSGGYNSYDTKRSALRGSARGSTDGGEFDSLLGFGYDFKMGNWSIGPTATAQYTYVGIGDFREHGSLAPLQIENQSAESFRTAIGFRTSYNIQLRNGMIIRPDLRLAWQHEFADQGFTLDSRFASGAGGGFSVDGPEYGRDSLLLSAGVALQLSDRTVIYVSYDGELARRDYTSNSVSGGVRVAF